MFYLLLRLLYEEMDTGKITKQEYTRAIEGVAVFHGFKKNGIR